MVLDVLGMNNIKRNRCGVAFTLAEVLIALVIIGIIAAITVPTVIANSNHESRKSQFRKAVSTLNDALRMTTLKMGYVPECYYVRDSAILNDDESRATNAELKFDDCNLFFQEFYKNLNIVKECPNGIQDGCMPEYDGVTNAYCNEGFSKQNFKTRKSYVLADGMILIPYRNNNNNPTFAIDINGQRKPNKGGHDLFTFSVSSHNHQSIEMAPTHCLFKTGKTTMEMYKDSFVE